MEEKKVKVIDIIDICKAIIRNKKTFFITLPIAFVLSCIYILSFPRYYVCEVKLAPEIDGFSNNGSLSSLASSFGLDMLNTMNSSDAIFPELYPDLMNSIDFTISLLPIEISTKESNITTTYSDYLQNHTKTTWWNHLIIQPLKKLFEEKDTTNAKKNGINPFMLTKPQMGLVKLVQSKINCNVDKKTQVISISVTDQDPLVSAIMADSAREKLQDFITLYRTNKAKNDLEFTKKLFQKAKSEYETATQTYASFSDANQGIILQTYLSKKNELENDMQLKFNTYNALAIQYQSSLAKVQERTPAFTVLQGATVPIKPAGPKRMFFVAFVLFLTFIGTTFYVYFKK